MYNLTYRFYTSCNCRNWKLSDWVRNRCINVDIFLNIITIQLIINCRVSPIKNKFILILCFRMFNGLVRIGSEIGEHEPQSDHHTTGDHDLDERETCLRKFKLFIHNVIIVPFNHVPTTIS